MYVTPVNIFLRINTGYLKQSLNKNKVSPAQAGLSGIYYAAAQSTAFGAARKAETRRASSIYRKIPVDRKKLEIINKTLNSYNKTLPKADETFNNFIDIYQESKNKALHASRESLSKFDEEGNFRCTEGIDITSDLCSVDKAFTYNAYTDALNSYKEGFINSTKPLPDGRREIKKGVINNPDAVEGEYFENRIYETSSFKKGSNDLNRTEKLIIFDSRTNSMLKYSEDVLGDDRDDGSILNFAKRTVLFDSDGTPLSYREKLQHHNRDDYDSAKRVITFTKDSNGSTVPKYYYEDWKCFNGQNKITYSYKAERLENGSWIAVR